MPNFVKRTLLIAGVLLLSLSTCWAASDTKPRTAILFSNNIVATAPVRIQMESDYLNGLNTKLSPSHSLIFNEPYTSKLKSLGYTNLLTVERSKLIPIFSADNIDYVIIIDLQPLHRDYYETSSDQIISSEILRVIDIKNDSTLYNQRLTYTSRHSSAQRHVSELYKKSEEAIISVLPMKTN